MLDQNKLQKIADFWKGDNWNPDTEEGYRWPKDPYSDNAQEVERIFWDELISGNHFKPEGKMIMTENGYRVFAGDRDSFGILVACVSKDGKAFSFG